MVPISQAKKQASSDLPKAVSRWNSLGFKPRFVSHRVQVLFLEVEEIKDSGARLICAGPSSVL